MGEARRRGTKEQRVAQAVERARLESLRRSEQHRALMREQHEARAEQARRAGIPPVLVADEDSSTVRGRLLLAAALAFSLPPMKRGDR